MKAAALVAALALQASLALGAAPAHELSIRLDPEARTLTGRDVITFGTRRSATLLLNGAFKLEELRVEGRRIEPRVSTRSGLQRIAVPASRRIELQWTGALAPLDTALTHREVLGYQPPASGPQGAFLSSGSGWYPAVDGELESYQAVLDLPAGQRGLFPGRLTEERETGGRYTARFEFNVPTEGITLMAGPYRVTERMHRTPAGATVRLRTYFHAELASLAADYLTSVGEYLDLYERRIGPYPFSEFSVVSSPTPTGFGMPTLTYLGIQVLKLPFIRATSLGHEVLHNWWGNGVYADYARGNWAESLTTFMADYAYRERAGAEAAHDMRLGWLRDYAAMPREQDAPLARFASRTHGASQIVGYNKGAMMFLMLRDLIGEASFDEGVRRFWREQRFRVASWDDLRGAFEGAAGRPLAGFFGQWLERPGAPELRITEARAEQAGDGWRVSGTVSQGSGAYALSVPLAVRTVAGNTVRRVEVSRPAEKFVIELDSEPVEIVLDPDHRLFRRLQRGEAPPILREVMLSPDANAVVLPADEPMRQAAAKLAARFFEQPPRMGRAENALSGRAALVIGQPAQVGAWLARHGLPARPANLDAAQGSAQVWTVRGPGEATLAIVSVKNVEALNALMGPLPHYGRVSHLVFEGSRMVKSGVWPARPQAVLLR